MHINDDGLCSDESDTIRQEHLLFRLKQIIAQVSCLGGSDAFINGNNELCQALICLMQVESEWQYEHEMLKGEI